MKNYREVFLCVVFASLLLGGACARDGAKTPTQPDEIKISEEVVREFLSGYVDAINSLDVDAIERFHAPQARSIGGEGLALDAQGRREYFEERIKAFPDNKMTVTGVEINSLGRSTATVTYDFVMRATFTNDFKGIPAHGQPVELAGSCVFDLAATEAAVRSGAAIGAQDLRIVRETATEDFDAFLTQLRTGG